MSEWNDDASDCGLGNEWYGGMVMMIVPNALTSYYLLCYFLPSKLIDKRIK